MQENTETHIRTTYTHARAHSSSHTQFIHVHTRANTQTRTHKHASTKKRANKTEGPFSEKEVAVENSTREFPLRDGVFVYILPSKPPAYGTLALKIWCSTLDPCTPSITSRHARARGSLRHAEHLPLPPPSITSRDGVSGSSFTPFQYCFSRYCQNAYGIRMTVIIH